MSLSHQTHEDLQIPTTFQLSKEETQFTCQTTGIGQEKQAQSSHQLLLVACYNLAKGEDTCHFPLWSGP